MKSSATEPGLMLNGDDIENGKKTTTATTAIGLGPVYLEVGTPDRPQIGEVTCGGLRHLSSKDHGL